MEHVSLVPERFGHGRAHQRQRGRQRGKERKEKGEFCRSLRKKPSISKRWAGRHVSGGGGWGSVSDRKSLNLRKDGKMEKIFFLVFSPLMRSPTKPHLVCIYSRILSLSLPLLFS